MLSLFISVPAKFSTFFISICTRYEGFWWSPCGGMIAYTESDESHVPEYTIMHQVCVCTLCTSRHVCVLHLTNDIVRKAIT